MTVEELRKKRIFVATPMYGGQCSGMYTKASCDLATIATKYGMDLKFFYLFNESLITRARNYLVDEFIRSDYEYLMFIDSDIHFSPNDVLTLAALCDEEKHPIIGGPYPKKTIAWEKVRNAVDAGLADDNVEDLDRFTGDFVFNPVGGTRQIKISEPVEVLEIGTGFMMVHRSVFEKFKEAYPQFTYKPDHNRSEHFDGKRYIHAYFDTVIDSKQYLGDIATGTDRYLSEDYFFCQFARKIGVSTWLCPWMHLSHVGNYIFNGSLSSLSRVQYAAHGYDKTSRPHLEQRIKKLQEKGLIKGEESGEQTAKKPPTVKASNLRGRKKKTKA